MCCTDAAQREAVLSDQLAERVRELAEAEECMGYLHAEADARAARLAAETARADAADADRTDLAAAVAERDSLIATLQQAHAEQVCRGRISLLSCLSGTGGFGNP